MDALDLPALEALLSRIPVWFGFAWMGAVVVASLVWRVMRGKPLFATPPRHAVFLERWRSGRQTSTLLGRLGGASNGLMVAVGEGRLRIGPHFPFSLMFLPEVFALEADVPLVKVRSASLIKGWIFREVVLEIDDGGRHRRFELHLANPEALLAALGKPPQSSL